MDDQKVDLWGDQLVCPWDDPSGGPWDDQMDVPWVCLLVGPWDGLKDDRLGSLSLVVVVLTQCSQDNIVRGSR